jgi:hypothetical protein
MRESTLESHALIMNRMRARAPDQAFVTLSNPDHRMSTWRGSIGLDKVGIPAARSEQAAFPPPQIEP